ncbi:hypothetical protein FF1_042583 [Malus domestica]
MWQMMMTSLDGWGKGEDRIAAGGGPHEYKHRHRPFESLRQHLVVDPQLMQVVVMRGRTKSSGGHEEVISLYVPTSMRSQ